MSKLSHTVITDPLELTGLQESWQTLSSLDPKATLFNSFAWVECWMRYFWAANYTLHIVTISSGGKPLALLPLYFNTSNDSMMFLGTGEPEHCEVASEYLDFLIDPDSPDQQSIYHYIATHLNSLSPATFAFVNCLDSSHVFHTTTLLRNVHYQPTGSCFRIDRSTNFEQLARSFSKNHRKKTREITNRFNNNPQLRFQPLTEDNYEDNWRSLRELHTLDWNSRGKPGAFTATDFNNFHKHMHEEYPQAKQLFAYLAKGDEIFSINHYYQANDTVYFYASGSDKNAFRNLSPGILLHTLCLSSLSGQKLVYDFMKGASIGSYKEKFCQASGCFYTITIYSQDLSGKVLLGLIRSKTALSRLKRKLKR